METRLFAKPLLSNGCRILAYSLVVAEQRICVPQYLFRHKSTYRGIGMIIAASCTLYNRSYAHVHTMCINEIFFDTDLC
jgi:hypothetical protein